MKLYQNIMEELVEEFYDNMKGKSGVCTCEQCRADVVAYALNQLPPQYVTTSVGANMSKLSNLRLQHTTDIHVALTQAFQMVLASPRHELKPQSET